MQCHKAVMVLPKSFPNRHSVKALRLVAQISSASDDREKNLLRSRFPKVEVPQEALPHFLFRRISEWSHLNAIECGIIGRKYTYGGLIDRALRWGAVVNQVLPPSSNMMRNLVIFSQNVPEFPIIYLGTQAVGATVVTISQNLPAAEVARHLKHCDAQLVVVDPKQESLLRAALEKLKAELPVFVNGISDYGSPNVREILEDNNKPFAELAEIPNESIAAMMYTSATTGKTKGVALSHRALTANVAAMSQPGCVLPYNPPSANIQGAITGLLPFFHVSGSIIINLYGLYNGNKIISLPAFDPQDYIRIIKENKIECLHLTPPLLNFLAKSPDITSDDLARIRYVLIGAAPVPVPTALAFRERANNLQMILEGYGLTEALATHSTPLDQEKLGWCGILVSNTEAKVVELSTGESLPEGEKGELCIKSPSLMSYYYKDPETTAKAIDSEGWLHTGDVVVHEDGFFRFINRVTDLIKVKGYQVSPTEVEEELLKHPGVLDVGVVGLEADRTGVTLLRAYVVRESKRTSADDLMIHMQERVPPHMQIEGGIRFVDDLPKNPAGKILRRQLEEMASSDP